MQKSKLPYENFSHVKVKKPPDNKLLKVQVFILMSKLKYAMSGNQASCDMRPLRTQLCCTLPSLFLLRVTL